VTSLFSAAHIVLLQKAWQALAGLVTVALVTRFLSPAEQGYYYAIGSLVSSFLVLDLGLSGLLVQVSARMSAGLSLGVKGALAPEGLERQRFLQMLAWCRRWYTRAGLLTLLLFPLGYAYFSAAEKGAPSGVWQLPWLVVVLCAAASMTAMPLQALVEGAGRVAEVYLVRLGHYAAGSLLAWGLLVAGLGVYAPAMAPLAVTALTFLWVHVRYPRLLEPTGQAGEPFPWREQLWPLQKRVALTWAANYAFLNAPTLVAFYFIDPASAGRLGLSMVVANLLGSMCASWLIAKTPLITQLAASGERSQARATFAREFFRALVLMAGAYAAMVLVVWGGAAWEVMHRFLPPSELLVLAGAFLVFHGMGMLAIHFRALGQERLALPMAVATAVGVLLAGLLAQPLGLLGICGAIFLSLLLVCVPMMGVSWRGSASG
jgi:hypothetical protein